MQEDRAQEPPWSLSVHKNVIWALQCPCHVSKSPGCYPVIRQIKVGPRVPRRHSRFLKTVKDQMSHLWQVLILLKDSDVTLKLKKCCFLAEKCFYLGHVFRSGRLHIASTATSAVRQLKEPNNQTKLWSFFGLCNVFHRFVPNLSHVAAPHNKKPRKYEPTQLQTLSVPEKNTVVKPKFLLKNLSVLALPRADGHLFIDTDTCDTQLECVLLQTKQDGTDRPIR